MQLSHLLEIHVIQRIERLCTTFNKKVGCYLYYYPFFIFKLSSYILISHLLYDISAFFAPYTRHWLRLLQADDISMDLDINF